jgi:hypothetical protein
MRLKTRTLIYALIATLSVGGLMFFSWALHNRSTGPIDESQSLLALLPAHEYRPFHHGVAPSDDFMIVRQHFNQRDITQPVSYASPDPQLIEIDCLILTIVIEADRSVSINNFALGNLDDLNSLAAKLQYVFHERAAYHVYRGGLEMRTDLPVTERIRRTVLVRPAPSVSYGDVVRVVELLRQVHADPIGIQTNHFETWTLPCARPTSQNDSVAKR